MFSALEGLEMSSVDDTRVKINNSIKALAKETVGIWKHIGINPGLIRNAQNFS